MRELVNWKDHVVQYPGRFEEQDLGGGLVQHTPSPGKVEQQGTPQNATNFNIMDLAAFEAMLMASENARELLQVNRDLAAITGEKIQVTLTNSQQYPHNNSKKTVQLSNQRNNMDYTVECEVVSVTGGAVGEFEFSDKLLNGFKIAYTGTGFWSAPDNRHGILMSFHYTIKRKRGKAFSSVCFIPPGSNGKTAALTSP